MVMFWTVTLRGRFSSILNSLIFPDYEEKLIPCHALYSNQSLVPPGIGGTQRQIHGNHTPQKAPEYRDLSRLDLHFYLCAGSWRFITLEAKQQPPRASVPVTAMSVTSSPLVPSHSPPQIGSLPIAAFHFGEDLALFTFSSRPLLDSFVAPRNNE